LLPWGNALVVQGKHRANTYQGRFPVRGGDRAADGFAGLAPVKQYPANRYGLFDMVGNVWEWCSDWYHPQPEMSKDASSGAIVNPQGPARSLDPSEPNVPKRSMRGGSFLCHDSYCSRYLLGSRGKGDVTAATNHIGFRCVKSGP
jgi:formylglycine-generating enzyme required for sulfatase activity